MALSELFFGAKIAEAAVNKVKGRGKIVDANIEGGKKSTQNTNKISNAKNIDESFAYIEKELCEYVLEQEDYLKKLSIAFKRPLISTQDKSFKNMIFVFGPEGSGRKYSIRVIAKLLTIQGITKESSIYRLDFSQYSSEENVDKLLLPDLYKAFYGKSPIVIIENYDLASNKARSYISNLGINGAIKLDKRFSWKNGTLTESTGSYDIGSSDSLSANNKYIVLISKQKKDIINRLFSKQFVEGISDVLETAELSEQSYVEIAKSLLEDCDSELRNRNGIGIDYLDIVEGLVSTIEKKQGVHGIINAIEHCVYDSIIEQELRGEINKGTVVHLGLEGRNLYGNGQLLRSLSEGSNEEELAKLDEELGLIIGLNNVKEFVYKLRQHIEFEKKNKKDSSGMSLHMIFCGNPGTGKTTIARLVARYLKALGCISSGHLVEVTRADLVGQYLGQTAPKTTEKIRSALGGVLFIDEAYALSRSKDDFFGVEAIDTIVKYMEDYRDDLVVILAGYTKEMNDFLDVNSGLKSRFNYVVEFPDYTADEMLQITDVTAKKNKYSIDLSCRESLKKYYIEQQNSSKKDAGNGRLVRNTVEKAIINHSNRMADSPYAVAEGGELYTLTAEDFNLQTENEAVNLSELDKELNNIVGLDSVKDFIHKLKSHIEFEKRSGTGADMSLHMIFCGNPGTGKTTVARIVAKYFEALGILTHGQLVEVSRADLVSGYVGQTAIKTANAIQSAMGGILFVDEAYSLVHDSQDSFGLEAVDTLVKCMEDNRGNLVVILAGYTKEMTAFLKSNSGLKSRFNYTVEFPDYTTDELMKISDVTAASKHYSIDSACREALKQHYSKQQSSYSNDAGNGRLVRNTIEKAIFNHSQRMAEMGFDNITQDEIYLLSTEDFGLKNTKKLDYDLEAELAPIIGLDSVKDYVRSLYAMLRINKARAEYGIVSEDSQTMHMIFTGNPGTGKTTMARIVAKILYEMEILPVNKLVETDRASLVAGYVGQTAEKTLSVFEQAKGGVLFIDEAYSLVSGGENDFGKEAIDTMVKYMEDNRDSIVVILAGYTDDMERFLSANPGLTSRFPNIIDFPNYSSNELLCIIEKMYQANHYALGEGTAEKLIEIFDGARSDPQFGNGRFARNLCEKSIRNLSLRITKSGEFTKEALTTILPEDIFV